MQKTNLAEFEEITFKEPASIFSYSYVKNYDHLYANFMRDDIGSYVVPFGTRFSDTSSYFQANFVGETDECEKFKILISETIQYSKPNETDFISDVINEIGSNLGRCGVAYYEILDSIQTPIYYKLHKFYENNTFKTCFGFIQVSRKTKDEFGEWINRFRVTFLRKKRVCMIEFPKNLGGLKRYKKALMKIEKFGDTPNSFLTPDSKGNFPNFGFDFKHAQRNVILYRGVVTRNLGYDFRGSDIEYMTEFLQVHRYLDYQITKSVIRTHIVEQLNSVAERLGINSKIILTGLPTANYLKAIQNRLIECDISFEDAIKASEY